MNTRLTLISQLDNFASRLSSITNLDTLIETVKDILEEIVDVEHSGLYLYDQVSGSLRLYYAKGFTEEERIDAERTADKRHPGLVFRTKKKIHIPDVTKDSSRSSSSSKRSFTIYSRLYLPVMSLNKPVGTFGLASTKKNYFTDEHIAVLSFVCNLAGVVYSNINYLDKNKEAAKKERKLSKEIVKKNNELRDTFAELEVEHYKLVDTLGKLEESNNKFRMLSDSTFEAIFFSEKGICTNQNSTAEKMFGYTLDEAIGKKATDWIHPDYHKEVIDKIKADYEKPYEAVAQRKDGSTFPCEIQGKISDSSNSLFRVTALRDITERKNAEAAQKDSEEKYQVITQSSMDMIVILNKLGKIEFVNKSVERSLGYSAKELLGKSFTKYVPKKEIPSYLKQLKKVFLEKEVKNYESQIIHKEGHSVDVEINGRLIQQGGKTVAIGSVRDISFRKKAKKLIEESNKKLRQSSERLEYALLGSDAGLWDWNIIEGTVYFSDRWCQMLGYHSSEVEANIKSWKKLVHPDDMEMVMESLTEHLESKKPIYQTEHRMKTKSGKWKWILDTGKVTERSGRGKALRAVGTHIDITKRKEDERRLKSNEKYLKTINQFASSVLKHNTIDEIVWEVINLVIKDLELDDCVIYLVDEGKEKLIQRAAFGSKQSDEKTVKDPIVIPLGKGIVGTVAKTGIPEIIHDTTKDPRYILDDQMRYSELAVPIMADGEVVGVIDTEHTEKNFYNQEHLDRLQTISGLVSSRMKNAISQEKLLSAQVSLKKLSTAVEQSPLSIFITDVEGIIEFVNPAFIETTGYTADESIGKNANILKSGKQTQKFYAELWNTIKEGKKWGGEIVNKKKNGELIWVINSISPIRDNDGKIINFVAIQADISAQKKLEQELIKSKDYAEKASKAKSEFLANMSHEIRTPMNAILGFSEVLYHKLDSPQHQKLLTSILSSGNLLLSLLNDILDLSKIEAGKMEIVSQPVDLSNILQEIRLIFEGKSNDKGIQITSQLSENFPQVLNLDEIRIKQVIFNLVGNAVKFTEKGYVNIRSEYIDRSENTGDLIIEVEDTGIGIPKAQQELIFKEFTQQSGQSNRKYGGAGLGLSISKRLIEKMNGEISIISKKGKGSVFRVFIPEVEKIIVTMLNSDKGEEYSNIVFENAKILVVDDVSDNIETIDNLLFPTNITVIRAENGEDALEILKHIAPDLILLDIRMPGIDGYEVAHQVKSNPKLAHIPIIAYTASVFSSEKIDNSTDFDGLLFKPVNLNKLISQLANFLTHTRQTANLNEKVVQVIEPIRLPERLVPELPVITKVLTDEFLPRWKRIENQLVLFKIEKFASDLLKFANEYEFQYLIDYANKLIDDLEIVDLQAIQSSLRSFPLILQELYSFTEK